MENKTTFTITFMLLIAFAVWLGLQDFELWQVGVIMLGIGSAILAGSSV